MRLKLEFRFVMEPVDIMLPSNHELSFRRETNVAHKLRKKKKTELGYVGAVVRIERYNHEATGFLFKDFA